MQVERRADADRDAVDAGDHGLFHLGQCHQEIPDLGAAIAAGGDNHEIGKVVAGREGAGNTEEDMDADRRIGVALGKGLDIFAYMARVSAFFLSGRFMRMIWMAPWRSTRMWSVTVDPL